MIAAFAAGVFAQTNTPAAAVTSFYKFSRSQSQDFNSRGIESRKRWFSTPLYKLFLNELQREKEFLKKNPTDMPFFGNGVPFQPIDETCEAGKRSYRYTYSVGKGEVNGDSATVPVSFTYPAQCKIPPTIYKVVLVKAKTGWLIDDMIYPNGPTLVADLKRTEY